MIYCSTSIACRTCRFACDKRQRCWVSEPIAWKPARNCISKASNHWLNRSKFDILSFLFRRLQENKLEMLDVQLFLKLRSLKILDISQNRLMPSLPRELFLSIYHIRGEIFIAIELCFALLFTRSILQMTLNWFTSAFASLHVQSIEVINLAHNKLRDLPNLQEQTELEELDLSKNELNSIRSDDFKHLRSLKTLRISENFIGK